MNSVFTVVFSAVFMQTNFATNCTKRILLRIGSIALPIYRSINELFDLKRDGLYGRVTAFKSHAFSKKQLSEKDLMLIALNQWNPGCSTSEKRAIAQILISCYEKKSTQLTIISSNVRVLPDIFSFSGFDCLKILSLIDFYSLTFLPESIGDLSELQVLDLRNCHSLAQMPSNLVNLRALKHLDLSGCDSLTRLPTNMGNLKSLAVLDLTGCHSVMELPENTGRLSRLKTLRLTGCHAVTSLPDSISSLTALERLVLKRCIRLTRLPTNIGDLGSSLKVLDLADCLSLSGLPNEIVNFQSECNVDLTGCRLSQTILDNLIRTVTNENYNGPRIRFSMQDGSKTTACSLEELLVLTFKNASSETNDLFKLLALDESSKQIIAAWLSRMKDTADANSAGKTSFYQLIVNYLKLANENAKFRQIFLQILQDASRTCGDRVSLSVLHLGIAARKITCDKKDLKAYAELLRGLIALGLLEEVARAKVQTLRFVDEIEVYLGYPVMLKEALNLPIDIQGMRFFICSGITPQDLREAEGYVLSHVGTQEALLNQLVKNNDWLDALKAEYPEQFAAIEKARDTAMDSDDADYVAIGQVYIQALIELSRTALA